MFFNGVSPANVTAQPFFENALGGPAPRSAKDMQAAPQAVAINYGSLIKATAVSDLWNKINAANGWILGRTMFSQPVAGGTTGQAPRWA